MITNLAFGDILEVTEVIDVAPNPREAGQPADTAAQLLGDFARQVRDALNHLSDPVYLQTHSLARFIARSSESPGPSAGRRLQQALSEAIADLQPAGSPDAETLLARGARLLQLRFVEGLEIEAVQRALAIGRSEYYSQQRRAFNALVSLLKDRWGIPASGELTSAVDPEQGAATRSVEMGGSLPVFLTPLIDREQEIAWIRHRLSADPQPCRLITLTGPPGVGKTRLALEVAQRVTDRYPHGVYFVRLAPLREAELVPTAIAQVLRAPVNPVRPPWETLARYLRDKHLLLVLDNFEQIIGAAPPLAGLLETCPGVQALVTSQALLRVAGEQEFVVPLLAVPDSPAPDPDRLQGCSSVALFVARARTAQPDFRLDAESAADVAAICARLEGLPLAIELAAARTQVLSPRAILGLLGHRLDLLTRGPRDQPLRHQTLRAAIDWSYQLLTPDEQASFRRLAIFTGGFRAEAAAAICHDWATPTWGPPLITTDRPGNAATDAPEEAVTSEMLDRLVALVDRSLLKTRLDPDGATRFWMLEIIREYARERLQEAGEFEEAARRHARYVQRLAHRGYFQLTRSGQLEWLNRFELERDNLRAALQWLDQQNDVWSGIAVAGALWRFWSVRGYLAEGRRWLEGFLSRAPAAPVPPAIEALWALFGAGRLALEQGDDLTAEKWFAENLRQARQAQSDEFIAAALTQLGYLAYRRGTYDRARALHQEALAIRRQIADERGISISLYQLGRVALAEEKLATARSLVHHGLAISRQIHDQEHLAIALDLLAQIALAEGNRAAAEVLWAECLVAAEEIGYRRGSILARLGQARIAIDSGRHARAWQSLQAAKATILDLGMKEHLAGYLETVAPLLCARQHPELAIRCLGAAAALRDRIGVPCPPFQQRRLDEFWSQAHAQLEKGPGSDAWRSGRAAEIDPLLAEVASQVERSLDPTSQQATGAPLTKSPRSAHQPLSPREREVASLVAEGLSNREIARVLRLSKRTVDSHVEHIRRKLQATSRTQIAIWLLRQRADPDRPCPFDSETS